MLGQVRRWFIQCLNEAERQLSPRLRVVRVFKIVHRYLTIQQQLLVVLQRVSMTAHELKPHSQSHLLLIETATLPLLQLRIARTFLHRQQQQYLLHPRLLDSSSGSSERRQHLQRQPGRIMRCKHSY